MTDTQGHADRGLTATNGPKGGRGADDGPAAPAAGLTPTRVLVALGAAGPVLFLAVAALLGLIDTRYDAASQPMSELVLGPLGWAQTASFYATGLSFMAFALGFALAFRRLLPRRSRAARALIGLAGVLIAVSGAGLIMSGVFPTDPSGGPQTEAGALHDLAFLVVLLPLILAYPAAALAMRKVPGWGRYALATGLMPVAVFGLTFVFVAFAGDPGDPLYAVGGLVQRALLAVAFGWITLTGWRLLRRPVPGDQHAGSPVR
jgi:hypothetical protein